MGTLVPVSILWKVLVGLLVTLPVGAYVAGTLVASQADMPAQRAPVVITDQPSPARSAGPDPRSGQSSSPSPRPSATRSDDDRDDDRGDDHGGDRDDDLEEVRPTPRDVDDDSGGDDD